MARYNKSAAVKGMTLIEIIISLVVFSITALILVEVGSAINSQQKNSVNVNRRVTAEKPFAINSRYDSGKTGDDQKVDCVNSNMKIVVEISSDEKHFSHDVELKGENYKTKPGSEVISADTYDAATKTKTKSVDLQFVNIDMDAYAKYKRNDQGYYVLQGDDGKTYYKKDGAYYENKGTEASPDYQPVDVDSFKTVKVQNELIAGNVWRSDGYYPLLGKDNKVYYKKDGKYYKKSGESYEQVDSATILN